MASEDDNDFVAVNGEKCTKVSPSGEEPLTSAETSGGPQMFELPTVHNLQDCFDIPALLPTLSLPVFLSKSVILADFPVTKCTSLFGRTKVQPQPQ